MKKRQPVAAHPRTGATVDTWPRLRMLFMLATAVMLTSPTVAVRISDLNASEGNHWALSRHFDVPHKDDVLAMGAKPYIDMSPNATGRIAGPRIVDLTRADPQEAKRHGFMVSVQEATSGAHFCGGSLIAPRWVLTAAHCIPEPGTAIQVSIGGLDLRKTDQFETIPVRAFVSHGSYDPYTMENDIALLELQRPVSSEHVKPIVLNDDVEDEAPGTSKTVIGWGALYEHIQDTPPVLRTVSLPLVSSEECNRAYSGPTWGDNPIDAKSMLCAGYREGGRDSCQGDSGGPMFFFKGAMAEPEQVGVVSWGEGCARANRYGIYTRVSRFKAWIEKKIEKSLPVDDQPPPPGDAPQACPDPEDCVKALGVLPPGQDSPTFDVLSEAAMSTKDSRTITAWIRGPPGVSLVMYKRVRWWWRVVESVTVSAADTDGDGSAIDTVQLNQQAMCMGPGEYAFVVRAPTTTVGDYSAWYYKSEERVPRCGAKLGRSASPGQFDLWGKLVELFSGLEPQAQGMVIGASLTVATFQVCRQLFGPKLVAPKL